MQEKQTAKPTESQFLVDEYVKNMKKEKKSRNKFSILDFLVIISAFLVIGFLGYLVLNPDKEGSDTRNIHRSADVVTILTAVTNYIREAREIPDVIPLAEECIAIGNEICRMGPYDCTGMVDLSFLNKIDSEGESELKTIPTDPSNSSVNGTGYYIYNDGEGNITVCAPYAERNVEISFSKAVY